MGYPNSISMGSFGEYPKSKTVRALAKTDNIILIWSSGVHHRSLTFIPFLAFIFRQNRSLPLPNFARNQAIQPIFCHLGISRMWRDENKTKFQNRYCSNFISSYLTVVLFERRSRSNFSFVVWKRNIWGWVY